MSVDPLPPDEPLDEEDSAPEGPQPNPWTRLMDSVGDNVLVVIALVLLGIILCCCGGLFFNWAFGH